MTAAYYLSSTPALRERFEVTVYQMGWRLGGKGASGRNADACDRIEEHGLHVWGGFYYNAFRTMRACYGALGPPAGVPAAHLERRLRAPQHGRVGRAHRRQWVHWPSMPPPMTESRARAASSRRCGSRSR